VPEHSGVRTESGPRVLTARLRVSECGQLGQATIDTCVFENDKLHVRLTCFAHVRYKPVINRA
jgi:hypothetical protein